MSAVRPLAVLLEVVIVAVLFVGARGERGTRPGPRALWVLLFCLPFLVRGLAPLIALGPDAFSARAATGKAAIGLGAVWLGFTSADVAWPLLRRGLPAATALLGLALIASRFAGGEGLLGNTGYDLQVLLPGAVIGLFLWFRDSRAWLGLAAFLVTLAFAIQAPVVGGILTLGFFAGAGLIGSQYDSAPHPGQAVRAFSALGLATFAVLWFLPPLPVVSTPDAPDATEPVPTVHSELAGASVRGLIWKSLAALPGSASWPFGTGQFQAAYPPFRDPIELAVTTGNHTIEAVTEVEHPHNDTLLVFAENGAILAAGFLLATVALLVLGLCDIFLPRAARDPALAAGALALLVAGTFHAPLFANPIAALLGGLLLGAFGGSPTASRASLRLTTGALALVPLFLAASWGPAQYEDDSFDVVAARARDSAGAEARPWWDRALELHPHSIEALTGAGLCAATRGDLETARQLLQRAQALDPAYSVVNRNLERLGADLILAGHLDAGLEELAPLLARAGMATDAPGPAPAQLERLSARQPAPFDGALRAAAAWLHGRELFAAGSTSAAVFELRRAAVLAGHADRPLGALGVESAVYLSLQGEVQAARASLAEVLAEDGRPDAAERLIEELPETLQSAARLLARGIPGT